MPVWRYWILPFAWIVANFVASSDVLSSTHTSMMLAWVLHVLHLHVTRIELLNHILRKTGHFVAYAILGGLMFRAWRASLPELRSIAGRVVEPLWTWRWSALAIASSALAAAFDEWHQSFVPSRTATPRDVLLDTIGATFMQVVLFAVLSRRSKPAEQAES